MGGGRWRQVVRVAVAVHGRCGGDAAATACGRRHAATRAGRWEGLLVAGCGVAFGGAGGEGGVGHGLHGARTIQDERDFCFHK